MLPLALGMAGAMVKNQPLDASSWRTVHENLKKKNKLKYMRSEEMSQSKSIFATIDASVDVLPRTVQEQLLLMAVLASGVAASPEMLASLWDVVRHCQYLSVWCIGLYTSPVGLFLYTPSIIEALSNPAICVSVLPPYREKLGRGV